MPPQRKRQTATAKKNVAGLKQVLADTYVALQQKTPMAFTGMLNGSHVHASLHCSVFMEHTPEMFEANRLKLA